MCQDAWRPSSFETRVAWRPRWWNTLAFKLGLVVNLTVIVVLALSGGMAHRRDAKAQLQHAMNRLEEEARVLRAAWTQLPDIRDFQQFVDGFCREMTTPASPGHHVAVFDSKGALLLRAHERGNRELEGRMAASSSNRLNVFGIDGERFAAYSLEADQGRRVVVSVALKPVEEMLRAQGFSRAVTTAILVLILFGVTTISLVVWVRNPLREFVKMISAVGERRFDRRIRASGAAEFRFLAAGINSMTKALGFTERQRTREMEQAREIQRALVGDRRLTVHGCRIRAILLPTSTVGGDFYDAVPLCDGSTLLAVLDVTGHGVPAALCTALLRSSLRHLASKSTELGEIARGMNRDLCAISGAGVFATAVFIQIRPGSNVIQYVNAGQDAPLLVSADGNLRRCAGSGLLLGVDGASEYEELCAEVALGDKLFLFTDGLHEATSPQGEPFCRNRVADQLLRSSGMSLDAQIAALVRAARVHRQRNDFEDDVTIVGIQWLGVRGDTRAFTPLRITEKTHSLEEI